MKFDIVGLGACLVDYIALVPKIIGPEEKVNVESVRRECGGPTLNNLVQAARLGMKTAWLGKIGDDQNGRLILETFAAEGMSSEYAQVVAGAQSSYTWLAVDPNGDRCIYMFSNITREITPGEVRTLFRDAIAHSRAFHSEICQIPLNAVLEGVLIAKETGATSMIDMDVDAGVLVSQSGLGTLEQLGEIIASCDVLKAGAKLAMDYCGTSTAQETAQALLAKGPRTVVLTLGAKGCAVADRSTYLELEPPDVRVVDTTGAGDAFMGGMSYGILHGWSLERVGRFANACGSLCCASLGPMESGTCAELEARFGPDVLGNGV